MNRMDQALFQKYALEGGQPVLVAYCASWCAYCRRILPALKRLADQRRGDLAVGIMDVEMEPEVCREEQIEVLPTLVLYRGGEVLGSIVGPDSLDLIEEFLREALETDTGRK